MPTYQAVKIHPSSTLHNKRAPAILYDEIVSRGGTHMATAERALTLLRALARSTRPTRTPGASRRSITRGSPSCRCFPRRLDPMASFARRGSRPFECKAPAHLWRRRSKGVKGAGCSSLGRSEAGRRSLTAHAVQFVSLELSACSPVARLSRSSVWWQMQRGVHEDHKS